MTQAPDPLASSPPARVQRSTRNRLSRLNSRLAIVLVLFLGIAPIPFGGNRPAFWTLTGFLLALIATTYLGVALWRQHKLRHAPKRLAPLAIPFGLLLCWLVIQMVPLAPWGSPISIAAGNIVLTGKTLSLTPGMTFLSLIQFASYGLLFFLMLQATYNIDRARRVLVALYIIVVIYAAYALFALTQLGDPILFFEKWAYQGSATATFVNRNSFATFLSFGLVIGVALATTSLLPNDDEAGQRRNMMSSVLFAMGACIIAATLIATQSRMGFTAGVAGTLVTLVAVLSRIPRAARPIWPALLIGGLGTAALFWLYGAELLERVGLFESSLAIRGSLYKQVVEMIASRPLTGFGAGSFELAFPLFQHLPVSPDLVWDKAHSTYLSLWVELGLIFGSMPMVIVALIGISTWRIFRTARRRWLHAAISLGVITTAAVHSLVDFSLEIQAVAYMFVAILAIGITGPPRSPADDQDV